MSYKSTRSVSEWNRLLKKVVCEFFDGKDPNSC